MRSSWHCPTGTRPTRSLAVIEQMGRLPAHRRRSLTLDRGLEMAHHAMITAALSMPVFFCDPHHPCRVLRRGTVGTGVRPSHHLADELIDGLLVRGQRPPTGVW